MSSSTTKTKSSLSKDRFCSCGAAGCVIYPGRQCLKMPCKGSQCKRPIVTKIFFNEREYRKEKSIYDNKDNKLKKLDPNEDYFLSSYEDCGSINADEIDTIEKTYDDCKLTSEKPLDEDFTILHANAKKILNDDMELAWLKTLNEESDVDDTSSQQLETINFSFLGVDLKKKLKYIKKDNFYKTILVPFENLFSAIDLLNKNNIYHCDIKPTNIVLDKRSNTFKLIDFGLAIFDEISTDNNNRGGFTTDFISPEFFYKISGVHIGYGFIEDRSEYEKNADETVIIFTPSLYEFNKSDKKFIKIPGKSSQQINTSYYETLAQRNDSLIYSKNDIWSLGCVIKYILQTIVRLFNKESHTTTDVEINYFKHIIAGLNEIIQQIHILNISERPDAMEVLNLYEAFLKKTHPVTMSSTRGRSLFRNTKRLRYSRSTVRQKSKPYSKKTQKKKRKTKRRRTIK